MIRNTSDHDLKLLDLRIKEELGIDVQKYLNKEVAENLSDLLVFPQYALKCIISPLIIGLILFVAGFYVVNLDGYEYYIYVIIGFFLFIICAILIGLLILMRKMKTDMWGIMSYSLDLMESALSDLNLVNTRVTKENRRDVLNLLFSGIIYIVTIPMISLVIANKVPFIGVFVNKVVKTILSIGVRNINFSNKKVNMDLEDDSTPQNVLNSYILMIKQSKSRIERVLNISFRITKIPLTIGTVVSIFLLLTFIAVMSWL